MPYVNFMKWKNEAFCKNKPFYVNYKVSKKRQTIEIILLKFKCLRAKFNAEMSKIFIGFNSSSPSATKHNKRLRFYHLQLHCALVDHVNLTTENLKPRPN